MPRTQASDGKGWMSRAAVYCGSGCGSRSSRRAAVVKRASSRKWAPVRGSRACTASDASAR